MMIGRTLTSRWVWPAVIAGSAVALMLLTLLNVTSPIRVGLAFWFLGVCPGLALVRLLDIKEFASQAAVAIGVSLALDMLVSELIVYLGIWSYQTALMIIVGLTLVVVGLEIYRSSRTRTSAQPETLTVSHVDH